MVGINTQLKVSFDNYREYLLYYRTTHRNVWNQRLHFAATALAGLWTLIGVIQLNWRAILTAITAGYAIAWCGDMLIEQREPASFQHPLYATRANLDLCWDIVKGNKQL